MRDKGDNTAVLGPTSRQIIYDTGLESSGCLGGSTLAGHARFATAASTMLKKANHFAHYGQFTHRGHFEGRMPTGAWCYLSSAYGLYTVDANNEPRSRTRKAKPRCAPAPLAAVELNSCFWRNRSLGTWSSISAQTKLSGDAPRRNLQHRFSRAG